MKASLVTYNLCACTHMHVHVCYLFCTTMYVVPRVLFILSALVFMRLVNSMCSESDV